MQCSNVNTVRRVIHSCRTIEKRFQPTRIDIDTRIVYCATDKYARKIFSVLQTNVLLFYFISNLAFQWCIKHVYTRISFIVLLFTANCEYMQLLFQYNMEGRWQTDRLLHGLHSNIRLFKILLHYIDRQNMIYEQLFMFNFLNTNTVSQN